MPGTQQVKGNPRIDNRAMYARAFEARTCVVVCVPTRERTHSCGVYVCLWEWESLCAHRTAGYSVCRVRQSCRNSVWSTKMPCTRVLLFPVMLVHTTMRRRAREICTNYVRKYNIRSSNNSTNQKLIIFPYMLVHICLATTPETCGFREKI